MMFAPEVVAYIGRAVSVPVLETTRLSLRAPCREDAKALAALANEFRVAVNTARLPHPYRVEEADEFIAAANAREGEACFVVIRDGRLIGACSIDPRERGRNSDIGLASPFGAAAMQPRLPAPWWIMRSATWGVKPCTPALG
jgi:RimJ/RimL family protein N-acetyltransferase